MNNFVICARCYFIWIYMDSLRGSSNNIGTIQRSFAWPLRNDDAHKSRSVNILSWHYSRVHSCVLRLCGVVSLCDNYSTCICAFLCQALLLAYPCQALLPMFGSKTDPGETRTCNLWFRRSTPYPFGHRADAFERGCLIAIMPAWVCVCLHRLPLWGLPPKHQPFGQLGQERIESTP